MNMGESKLELRRFLTDLLIPEKLVDDYVSSFSKIHIFDKKDLVANASVGNLEKIGIANHYITRIMRQLFSGNQSNEERKSKDDSESTFVSRLTREAVVILREVGHGASGRVSKAIYCPTLTLLAVKRIEIENPAHRIVVGHELKILYEIARCRFIGPLGPSSVEVSDASQSFQEETHLNLLSGQLYSEVIAGLPSEMTSKEPPSEARSVIKAANNPYIINFYDAYIDPEQGAVCLLLEYMNCGSIQSMLNDGLTFDEDDAAVLAFSVLGALTDLHGRNILHRDIKPSNILTDTAGRIKVTDFGITKELTEDGPAAESFIGTLAYMSPERIRGVSEYSFEADMWSLGITMITVMTGNIPFPTANGSWQLMNAILEGPQPTITRELVSLEMHDFIHQCLNQPLRDKSCAQRLLNHAFLSSARERGILPMNKTAVLAKRGKLMPFDTPTNRTIERIVEVAISWQLEQLEDGRNTSLAENDKSNHHPPMKRISRYSLPQIEWLALQMGAETSVLVDKFNVDYALIDKLSDQGWNIEVVRKTVLPSSVKELRYYDKSDTVDSKEVEHSGPIFSSAKVAGESTQSK